MTQTVGRYAYTYSIDRRRKDFGEEARTYGCKNGCSYARKV
jgi:hypothetical protein